MSGPAALPSTRQRGHFDFALILKCLWGTLVESKIQNSFFQVFLSIYGAPLTC
jgi:hypothetical protein